MTERLRRARGFLLDMDGTFYLGDRLLEGALRFIDVLRAQGKDFLFLTNNSSKHRRQHAHKIARLGLPTPETKVLTSGEAAALYLEEARPGARLYVVGTPALSRTGCWLTRITAAACALMLARASPDRAPFPAFLEAL